MKEGYRVEYDNDDQVCIIPCPSIPLDDFAKVMLLYSELGYKWWLPADERRATIPTKPKCCKRFIKCL
jgi:hypothetical protein